MTKRNRPVQLATLTFALWLAACNPGLTAQDTTRPAMTQDSSLQESSADTTSEPIATSATGGNTNRTDALGQVPACPADVATPLLDTIPIDPNDFIAFRPLGFMTSPVHIFPAKHSSFSMTLPGGLPAPKPVRAPSRSWLMEVWAISFSTGAENYQVFIYPCREVRLYFGHVVSLSDKIMAALEGSQPSCTATEEKIATITRCRYEDLLLELESGETFGTGPDTAGVDFGLIDFRREPAGFVVPEHYDYYYLYYASPLDYFEPEARQALASKTGSVFGDHVRTAEPIGGSYMQDLPGTAQGNWFFPGTYLRDMPDISPLLALAHDYVDPAQPVMSIGTSIQGANPGLYAFTPERDGLINRDFGDVRADGAIFCYENFLQTPAAGGMPVTNFEGIILMSMPTDLTLTMEAVAGGSCRDGTAWAFTENATSFER